MASRDACPSAALLATDETAAARAAALPVSVLAIRGGCCGSARGAPEAGADLTMIGVRAPLRGLRAARSGVFPQARHGSPSRPHLSLGPAGRLRGPPTTGEGRPPRRRRRRGGRTCRDATLSRREGEGSPQICRCCAAAEGSPRCSAPARRRYSGAAFAAGCVPVTAAVSRSPEPPSAMPQGRVAHSPGRRSPGLGRPEAHRPCSTACAHSVRAAALGRACTDLATPAREKSELGGESRSPTTRTRLSFLFERLADNDSRWIK